MSEIDPRIPWPVWRLVMAEKATLHEIESHWNFSDLMEANDSLTAWQEAEARASKGDKP